MVTIDLPESVAWDRVPDLRLDSEQARFASRSLAEWMEETRVERESGAVVPFLVREDGRPVGFFALAHGEAQLRRYGRPGAGYVLLRNFLVVPEAQGRGIARVMMDRLPAIVRRYFPDAHTISLVVNLRNDLAQRLYLRHGYADSGDRWAGGLAGPAAIFDRALYPRARTVAQASNGTPSPS